MKTLLTAEAVSTGGRAGSLRSPDHLLDITLGNPLEPGAERRGPSPELLFAGAYSACYNGALANAAKKLGHTVEGTKVRALVTLLEDAEGGYHHSVELKGHLPGVAPAEARRILEEAHRTCPYSKALRGDATVTLTVE